jgi:hypothetical protein
VNLSEWCASPTRLEAETTTGDGGWKTVYQNQHSWCHYQRWHDEYHGKDPGCCATPEERESWACECPCHPYLAARLPVPEGVLPEYPAGHEQGLPDVQ